MLNIEVIQQFDIPRGKLISNVEPVHNLLNITLMEPGLRILERAQIFVLRVLVLAHSDLFVILWHYL